MRPGRTSQKPLLGIISTPSFLNTNFCTTTPAAKYTTVTLNRLNTPPSPSTSSSERQHVSSGSHTFCTHQGVLRSEGARTR
jgi:hypothetical protein